MCDELLLVPQFLLTLDEVKELATSSFRCLPLHGLIELIISSTFPLFSHAIIELPMGLKAYLPKRQIIASLRNVLHIFYYRDYEIFSDFIPRKNWIVIDVGAFIGLWSLRASRLVSAGGVVIALEPNPDNYTVCCMNMRLNKVNNVRLLPYALSSKSGTLPLYIPEQRINSSLCREYVNTMGGPTEIVKVRALTLEKLINSSSLSVIDLMKVDVEGHELELFKSLNDRLARRIRRLVIEVHKEVVDLSELVSILEKRGYSVYIYEEYLPIQTFIYAKHVRVPPRAQEES